LANQTKRGLIVQHVKSQSETTSQTISRNEPTWYKDAIIYQLHIKSFYDSNNDGIGDIQGLIQKLDYIAALGVNTIWLLPFYPSPLKDDGYDIADYYGVHPDYGTIEDIKQLIDEAHSRGLRVITELVINHTSDQHPWFQRARSAPPGSPERNYYVWSDNDKKYSGTRIIFLDTEKSNWAWDPEAESYYWHRFYSHQPDLNFDNPEVIDAVLDVMNFWLGMGIDGLRLDAVPYLVEREGTNNENLPETHDVLKKIRAEVDAKYPDRLLLAEANQWPEDTREYFGDGDECHMAFHFPLMPRMYMALAQEDRFPITDILRQTPEIPENCQWAIFLRNHDELTLEMVTDKERDYLWNQYASEARARLNLGIRRRLAPLVQRDRRRLEVLHSLLLSMPGTPIIYYGDEICMGDNVFLGDRDGVRTPMQWSPDRNGGFSKADPAQLMLPAIMDPVYGYSSTNVEAQSRDPHSFLNWMHLMLEIRKQYRAFGRGKFKTLFTSNRRVLAYLRDYTPEEGNGEKQETILCLANLSRSAQAVELDVSQYSGYVPLEMTGGSLFPPIGELSYLLTLPPYGFYWFLLAKETEVPDWYSAPPEPMPEYLTLVLRKDIDEVIEQPARATLEKEILPAYLPKRRWFAGKGAKLTDVRISSALKLSPPAGQDGRDTHTIIMTEVEATVDETVHRYQIPLTAFYEDQTAPALAHQLALARVRRKERVGELTDAVASDVLPRRIVHMLTDAVAKGESVEAGKTGLRFEPSIAFKPEEFDLDTMDIRTLSVEQSNSSVIIGEQAMLKVLRRLFPGKHPEVEISRALTEGNFVNTASLLGYVYRSDDSGEEQALAVLQRFIPSQGDAWEWMLSKLDQVHVDVASRESMDTEQPHSTLSEYEKHPALGDFRDFAYTVGQRLGEMHQVLAEAQGEDFTAETVNDESCERWSSSVSAQVEDALAGLQKVRQALGEADQGLVDRLVAQRNDILGRVRSLAKEGAGSLMFRIHGDLHLGQILVSQNDAYFIDFEGEPARSLEERRAKASPYRDVAGILRSFHYMAEVASSHSTVLEDEEMHASYIELLDRFRQLAGDAFLTAYHKASGELAHQWRSQTSQQALIELFMLEKAAYEISYEAANRPDWVRVPLRGLAEIVNSVGIE
jgi:maltose alpha-D-glucosyltransferase/alpha-amylase